MLSCSIWFSAPSFWMGGGLESRCVGRVYSVDGAVHGTIRTVNTSLYFIRKMHGQTTLKLYVLFVEPGHATPSISRNILILIKHNKGFRKRLNCKEMTTRSIKVQFNHKGQVGFSQQKCKGM